MFRVYGEFRASYGMFLREPSCSMGEGSWETHDMISQKFKHTDCPLRARSSSKGIDPWRSPHAMPKIFSVTAIPYFRLAGKKSLEGLPIAVFDSSRFFVHGMSLNPKP